MYPPCIPSSIMHTFATPLGAAEQGSSMPLPVYLSRVEAGFPSPADDYLEGVLDLNDLCIEDEAATFFVRASGTSMVGAGIHDGDLLVVSRARRARSGDIVIASLGGDLTVKRLARKEGRWWLMPESAEHMPIEVNMQLEVWGVVTHVIHETE